MKKFVYRMQSVLDIKQKLEDQEKSRYAEALARLAAENAKLESLQRRRAMYEDRLRQSVSQTLDLLKIRENREAIESLKLFISQQVIVVHKAEQNVEAALYRLRQAMMERKGQERLRENAFEEYRMEFNLEERKEIDELVSFQYGSGAKAAIRNGVDGNA